jgi:hypothetical protein
VRHRRVPPVRAPGGGGDATRARGLDRRLGGDATVRPRPSRVRAAPSTASVRHSAPPARDEGLARQRHHRQPCGFVVPGRQAAFRHAKPGAALAAELDPLEGRCSPSARILTAGAAHVLQLAAELGIREGTGLHGERLVHPNTALAARTSRPRRAPVNRVASRRAGQSGRKRFASPGGAEEQHSATKTNCIVCPH